MAASQLAAAHVGGPLAPGGEHVEVPLHQAFLAPQRQQRALDLAVHVGLVMVEVDAGGGAVILARGMDARRIAETAQVFGQGLFGESLHAAAPLVQLRPEVVRRVMADEGFRQAVALDEKEPVVVAGGDLLVDGRKDLVGGHDVEDRQLLDLAGMVEGHPMTDPAAAIVTGDRERLEAERRHHLDLVAGGGSFRVRRVVGVRGRFAAVAIAPEIGGDHGEPLGEPGCDLVPDDVGLGIAVQQQQRRTGAAVNGVDRRPAGVDVDRGESLEHVAPLPGFIAAFGRSLSDRVAEATHHHLNFSMIAAKAVRPEFGH